MNTTDKTQVVHSIPIATRITKPMQRAIQKVLVSNAHLNTADYIRDLIRRDLERRGLIDDS